MTAGALRKWLEMFDADTEVMVMSAGGGRYEITAVAMSEPSNEGEGTEWQVPMVILGPLIPVCRV